MTSPSAKERHGLFMFASPITEHVAPLQKNCIKLGPIANSLRDTIVSMNLCECRIDGMWLITCLCRSSRKHLPEYMTNVSSNVSILKVASHETTSKVLQRQKEYHRDFSVKFRAEKRG